MAGFIYYIPGKGQNITPAQLADYGLSYVSEVGLIRGGCLRGPDGGQGVIVAESGFKHPDGLSFGFYPDVQTWERLPESTAWIGHWTEHRPKPEDLARKKQFPGIAVRTYYGENLIVPTILLVDGSTCFPRFIKWDGKDWGMGDIVEEYRSLWSDALRVFSMLVSSACGTDPEESDVLTPNQLGDFAVKVCALNYRLGPAELIALGFTDAEWRAVIHAAVDWAGRCEIVKKKALDTACTEHGPTD